MSLSAVPRNWPPIVARHNPRQDAYIRHQPREGECGNAADLDANNHHSFPMSKPNPSDGRGVPKE
jgi:hypothetical protein